MAYADFVTAMMAFFMLMWLLGATTEKERKGLADYFNPTITVSRASAGGAGMFGGESVFAEDVYAQNGIGAESLSTTDSRQARGNMQDQPGAGLDAEEVARIQKTLTARAGESMNMTQALRHVVTRVTDEGLVIEVFDLEGLPLFAGETAQPEPILRDIALILAEVLVLTENALAVNGHLRAWPVGVVGNPAWDLSADRAQALRGLLESGGIPPARIARISGHADRKPATADPTAHRNNRVEVILLRRNR